MLFAALQYTAEEALRMGLVNRVLAAGDLEAFTRAYATAMARHAPLTQRAAKIAIRRALDDTAVSADDAVAAAAACFVITSYSIHYTKLYDTILENLSTLISIKDRQKGQLCKALVG